MASALSGKAQIAMARADWDAAEELLAQASSVTQCLEHREASMLGVSSVGCVHV